jgi:hypothetical protein
MTCLVKRLLAPLAVLLCVLIPDGVALAAAGPERTAGLVRGSISGQVVGVNGDTFTVLTAGRRMGVINAMVAAADVVAKGDYPYVWGGGHAHAGVASVGIPGPGHNGKRRGFDCSGAVAAVLAGAGLWPAGGSVPNDAWVIRQLLSAHLIARGPGRAPVEVTLYDRPGVHIFMNIDGRFFGTSDGGGGGNPRGGAGWLYDGAWDATNRAFKQYHILPGVLRDRTTYGHDFTFTDDIVSQLAGALQLGDRVRVGYAENRAGGMTATGLTWPGALTVAGTLVAAGADGSSLEVQLPSGQDLTLATGAAPGLLQDAVPGDPVSILYTKRQGVLTARSLSVTGAAVTGEATGALGSVAADGGSFEIQTADGRTVTFSTGGNPALLSGLAAGQQVAITYFQTVSGALVAQQAGPFTPGARATSGH